MKSLESVLVDPKISGQNFAVIASTPTLPNEDGSRKEIYGIVKVRGVYRTEKEASRRALEMNSFDDAMFKQNNVIKVGEMTFLTSKPVTSEDPKLIELTEKMEGTSLQDHLDKIITDVYKERQKEMDEHAKEVLQRKKELENQPETFDIESRPDIEKYLYAVNSTYSSRNLILSHLDTINKALAVLHKNVSLINQLSARDPSIVDQAREKFEETLKDIGTNPVPEVLEILERRLTKILDERGMTDLYEIGMILGDGRKDLFNTKSWKRRLTETTQAV